MPRCIPEQPSFNHASERVAWEALKRSLRPEDVLLAGLRVTDEKGDHELDLVVVSPGSGVAVIEVKGGSVSHDGNYWQQSGAVTKRIDPVEQARNEKYALRTYLERDPSWMHHACRFAHLVCFPNTSVQKDFRLPDCPRWMVLDRDDLADNPAGLVWDALVKQDVATQVPDQVLVEKIVDVLGGRMLPQRDLIAEAKDREAQADLMTERQAAILNALSLLKRVEVVGGAGSGKTWLALKQARRLEDAGQRVALICYSRGLAAFMRRRVASWPAKRQPGYVGEFLGLGLEWGAEPGADNDSDYWENRLPAAMVELAAQQEPGKLFDAIVVDEAQDFDDSWWPALLAGLKDDESGGLYVFSDEGQRVFARQGVSPVSLVPILLDENLRNTKPIARTFEDLTSFTMRTRGGEGDPVRFIPCAAEDALGEADDAVEGLLDAGWLPGQVALLTTGKRHPEQQSRQERGYKAYWDSFWDEDQVFYGHVLGFKGLERPAVVVALNGLGKDRQREKLYVALSRARDQLIVCGDPADVRQYGGESVLRRLQGG